MPYLVLHELWTSQNVSVIGCFSSPPFCATYLPFARRTFVISIPGRCFIQIAAGFSIEWACSSHYADGLMLSSILVRLVQIAPGSVTKGVTRTFGPTFDNSIRVPFLFPRRGGSPCFQVITVQMGAAACVRFQQSASSGHMLSIGRICGHGLTSVTLNALLVAVLGVSLIQPRSYSQTDEMFVCFPSDIGPTTLVTKCICRSNSRRFLRAGCNRVWELFFGRTCAIRHEPTCMPSRSGYV